MANRTAPRIRLTKTAIDDLPTPTADREIYYDARRLGLGLRVMSTGRKVWFWIGRLQGRTVRETLGTYPELAPDAAWAKARKVAATVGEGRRPTEARRAEREAEKSALTLGAVYADYCAHHVLRSPGTRDSEWRCYLRHWSGVRLEDLDRAAIRKWFRALSRGEFVAPPLTVPESGPGERRRKTRATVTGPSTANKALARLRALYGWARREMDWQGEDPTAGIAKHSEKPRIRRRRLQRDELKAFFVAVDEATPIMRDFFRLCLYTGQRAGNVKAMRWADLDLSGGTWHIPETKAGGAQDVILPVQAVEILEGRRKEEDDRIREAKASARARGGREPKRSPYVFAADSRSGHLETYQKAWEGVCVRAKLEGLRVHDLRRSLASFAQDADVAAAIVAAQLGHADPATTLKHYTAVAPRAQREAIGRVLSSILGGGQV